MTSPAPRLVFLIASPVLCDDLLTPYIIPHPGNDGQPVILRSGTPLLLVFVGPQWAVRAEVGPILCSDDNGVMRALSSQSPRCPAAVVMPRSLQPIDFYISLWDRLLLVSPTLPPRVLQVVSFSHNLPEWTASQERRGDELNCYGDEAVAGQCGVQ